MTNEFQDSLKANRDLKNSIDTAREEGILKAKIEIARNLKNKGFTIQDIIEITGLTKEVIEKL